MIFSENPLNHTETQQLKKVYSKKVIYKDFIYVTPNHLASNTISTIKDITLFCKRIIKFHTKTLT